MAKTRRHGKRPTKHTGRKEFILEDARRLFVMRAFAVTIEKKLFELQAASTEEDDKYPDGVEAIKKFLAKLDQLNPPKKKKKHGRGDDCWDEYELCDDKICRVWCS
jgi:hypothetical protein